MSKIEIKKEFYEEHLQAVKRYLEDEFDLTVGEFEVQFLMDFMAERMAPYYYNEGVQDSIIKLRLLNESVEEQLDLLRIL